MTSKRVGPYLVASVQTPAGHESSLRLASLVAIIESATLEASSRGARTMRQELLWLGFISGDELTGIQHAAMIPSMLVVTLHRSSGSPFE